MEPGVNEPVATMSAVIKFTPWNWVLGTVLYIDDMNKEFWLEARILLSLGAL